MNNSLRVLDPRSPPLDLAQGMCALAVMTKAPRAGKVKTRLTPPLTPAEAAALNTCFLRDTAAAIEATTHVTRAAGVGVYTPLGEEQAYFGILPGIFFLVPQRGDAFGERLVNATKDLLTLGFSSACLINSDSPTVPSAAFAEAVEVLAVTGDRIVIGPSDDGGYYLIGMKRLHARLFEEIDWSTERVLPQTIARASELGVDVHLLPKGYDIDDQTTLRRLCAELFDADGKGADAATANATRMYLAQLVADEGRARIWPEQNHAAT
jgi:rSAM/selenodomain-associated transferase 1